MPVDLTRLSEGWLELESDPGLFTLLLEDFGVEGVQVEEIYDLQKPISESTVYGFIFLFRWIEERKVRRKISEQDECFVKDEDVVNKIFFAQQVVPNSCATHALLSVLLNCSKLKLGNTLSRLKSLTSGMSPENKGWAIGNTPELARAHNSHVSPQARQLKPEKGFALLPSKNRSAGETFHFVSYVPINGRLFELDGLKPFPIDHGPWGESEDWTEKFRRVITERLGIATGGVPYHDIRFNLMAVVPDKRIAFNHKLKILKTNRQIVLEALQQLVKLTHPGLMTAKVGSVNSQALANSFVSSKKDSLAPKIGLSKLPCSEKERKCSIEQYENFLTSGLETTFHNYAKSVKTECKKDKLEECTILEDKKYLKSDYATPLTIQTSPAHSSSSTDTSSEVGSAFNSPTQAWYHSPNQNSPTPPRDIKKFVVIRVGSQLDSPQDSRNLEDIKEIEKMSTNSDKHTSCNLPTGSICPHQHSKEPHHFAPKDLLALLKHLEQEIANYEGQLRDEIEKRKKFKVDDCRRTHNYDQFICTFLSMLAAEGILADLVHIMVKKRHGLPICRPTKKLKLSDRSHRKRGRPKLKKR